MGLISSLVSKNDYKRDMQTAINLQSQSNFYAERHDSILNHPFFPAFKNRLQKNYNNNYVVEKFINAFLGDILPSTEIINTINNELKEVWNGQNQFFTIKLTNENQTIEAIQYLQSIDFEQFYRFEMWAKLFNLVNEIVIIDLPLISENTEIDEESLNPYQYSINIQNVKYINFDDDCSIKEILFTTTDKNVFYHYTNEYYSVIQRDNENEYYILEPTNHNIGYCPAKFFWNIRMNSKNIIARQTPFDKKVEALYKYVYLHTEAFKADVIYSNPDKIIPQYGCGNQENNTKCIGGKLYTCSQDAIIQGNDYSGFSIPVIEDGQHQLCSVCGVNQHTVGAGNTYNINFAELITEDGNQISLPNDLVKYAQAPIEGFVNEQKRVAELEQDIIKSCVGTIHEQTKQQINEKQVVSNYEQRTTILYNLGLSFSEIMNWSAKTILILKYGVESIENVNFFLGSDFFVKTEAELKKEQNETQNPTDKILIQNDIFRTKYKHNAKELKRAERLNDIMPYSNLNDEYFFKFVEKGFINNTDVELRNNFNHYISEFERITKNRITTFDIDFTKLKILELVEAKINTNTNIIENEKVVA